MNQDAMQETLAGGGGNGGSTTTGFATGTICTSSGTYRASNKYMDTIALVAAGEPFPPFVDGKRTTWFRLATSLSTNKEGSFTSVKVLPGTA
jgi:hypothetical protein